MGMGAGRTRPELYNAANLFGLFGLQPWRPTRDSFFPQPQAAPSQGAPMVPLQPSAPLPQSAPPVAPPMTSPEGRFVSITTLPPSPGQPSLLPTIPGSISLGAPPPLPTPTQALAQALIPAINATLSQPVAAQKPLQIARSLPEAEGLTASGIRALARVIAQEQKKKR